MTKRIPKPGQPVRGSKSGRAGMALFELLGRRWALRVIWELREGRRLNFRDLLAACEIAPSVLNTRLAELRETKLIEHDEEGYALTKQGAALLHLLMPLHDWADGWAASLKK
jgi:DNA-binding HxlR family transcriptional regulator